ncbi:MBL fold metallo-hydrolase [Gynuella sp.]|uniref:MBL fold metallo-hydrolase n=1 Tax=Gynuella sp. TaxID=2969146 RepID=UPI003D12AC7F
MKIHVEAFYDEETYTLTYVVSDQITRDAIVIDPVLDYEPIGSIVKDTSYQRVKSYIDQQQLNLKMVLETHAHADHLSASQLFKKDYPAVKIAIGRHITAVQGVFKGIYNLDELFLTDGSQFDQLIDDDQVFEAGSIEIKALFTPGHTPACLSYLIGNAVFTGDTLFMPDYGTGRCDFPGGDAEQMYHSIQRLYQLPDDTRVFTGHDYLPNGRALRYESTIAEQKHHNIQLNIQTNVDEYVKFRGGRDKTLAAPKLIYQSLLVNIEAGKLPKVQSNGSRYLKIPLNIRC